MKIAELIKEIIMVSLLFLILLFVSYSYLVSQAAIHFFPDLLAKIKYKWPIGFFIIMAFIQFVSFPMQYFHVSMQTVSIVYSVILIGLMGFIVIGLCGALKDKRQELFKLEPKRWMEYLLIGGFILFNFLICYTTNSLNDTNADQSFYITLVENNIGAEYINGILPLSGEVAWLDSYYNFQGFYLFLTFLATIFNLDAVLVMGWFVPVLLWLTVGMTFLNLIHYFNATKKSWMTVAIFVILWAFLGQFDYFVRYNVYGNNIRLFVFCYLMMGYCDYFKRSKTQSLVLCGLLWLSAASFQSTSLFLGIMLMVAIGLYELFIHRKNYLLPLVFSAISLIIYLSFFLSYHSVFLPVILLWILVGIFIIFSLATKTKAVINGVLYSKLFRILVVISILGMMVLSCLILPKLNPLSSISPSQFFEELFYKYEPRPTYLKEGNWSLFILALLRDMILLLNIFVLTQVKKLKGRLRYVLIIQVILILVFYNPIVSGFVSTTFTGSVYMRVSDIVLSLFLVCALLAYMVRQPKLHYVFLSLAVVSTLQLVVKTYEYTTYHFHQISNPSNFNHLYRMDQDIIDTATFIEGYVNQKYGDTRPYIFTTQLELNYFSHNYKMIYTVNEERRAYDESYRQTKPDLYVLRDAIRKSYEIEEEQQKEFKQILETEDIKIMVIPTVAAPWIHQVLDTLGSIIYENDGYIAYELIRL